MIRQQRQQGFSIAATIVAIVAAAVLVFVGWRVYDAHTNTTAITATQPATVAPDKAAATGYVVIKEWGVRFKPVSGQQAIEYQVGTRHTDGATVAVFTTKELEAADAACSADPNGSAALGTLLRTPGATDKTAAGNPTTKHIGSYYYSYVAPQSACGGAGTNQTNSAADAIQLQQLPLIKQAVGTLEATP